MIYMTYTTSGAICCDAPTGPLWASYKNFCGSAKVRPRTFITPESNKPKVFSRFAVMKTTRFRFFGIFPAAKHSFTRSIKRLTMDITTDLYFCPHTDKESLRTLVQRASATDAKGLLILACSDENWTPAQIDPVLQAFPNLPIFGGIFPISFIAANITAMAFS